MQWETYKEYQGANTSSFINKTPKGWEPFAVTPSKSDGAWIWLRRKKISRKRITKK